jgi:VanZ family protein
MYNSDSLVYKTFQEAIGLVSIAKTAILAVFAITLSFAALSKFCQAYISCRIYNVVLPDTAR